MKKSSFELMEDVIVRTPVFSFNNLLNKNFVDENLIDKLVLDSFFLEGIYISSPSLYNAIIKYKKNKLIDEDDIKKLKKSILKYFLRCSTRPTPFGVFSGCSIAKIGDKTELHRKNKEEKISKIRLDFRVSYNIYNELLKYNFILKNIKYKQNTSISMSKEGFYYVERKENSFEKNYIVGDQYLDKILKTTEEFNDYTTIITELIRFDSSIEEEEAFEFIKYLVSNQILVSNIEPNLNQSSYLTNLLEYIFSIESIKVVLSKKSDVSEFINNLSELNKLMKEYEKNNNTFDLLKKISNKLKSFNLNIQDSLIQVDTFFPFKEKNTISKNIIKNINTATKVLFRINNVKEYSNSFDDFKERFVNRYNESEVSLLEALDPEKGIGYRTADLLDDNFPIIDNLKVISKNKSKRYELPWNKFDMFLFNKYIEVIKNGNYELVLEEEEINDFEEMIPDIEDSFHVMISIGGDKDTPEIHFKSAMLTSPNKLIGRFTHLNENIKNLSNKIYNNARLFYNQGIVAEIMHTPKSLKHGNVLIRELDVKHEINFLSGSNDDNNKQIPLSDLVLFYKNKKLYLKSKSLGKIVYPQLNCAHNYGFNTLDIYNFLALFQLQNKTNSLHFKWGTLKNKIKFHPRVSYKKIILSEAYWILQKNDFKEIILSQKSDVIMKWRIKNKIPQYISLSKRDQKLFIDLSNPIILDLFINEIKNEKEIILREFLFNLSDNSIVNSDEGTLANEFIFSYLNKDKIINEIPPPAMTYKREIPIDNWLYYKIYCGTTDADIILQKLITPITKHFFNEKWINQFFFIRYQDDNGHHIRFRMYVNKIENIGKVMSYFTSKNKSFISDKLIWKIEMDSYAPETERYGGSKLMKISESLFFHDSKHILQFIEYGDIDKERLLFAIKTILIFIKQFKMNNEEIVSLMKHRRDLFIQEFNVNKKNKKYLNEKYNEMSSDLIKFVFTFEGTYSMDEYEKNINLLSENILFLVKTNLELSNFISNHIHMHVNRVFPSKQRKFELMIYYFLYKLYLSKPYLKSNLKKS